MQSLLAASSRTAQWRVHGAAAFPPHRAQCSKPRAGRVCSKYTRGKYSAKRETNEALSPTCFQLFPLITQRAPWSTLARRSPRSFVLLILAHDAGHHPHPILHTPFGGTTARVSDIDVATQYRTACPRGRQTAKHPCSTPLEPGASRSRLPLGKTSGHHIHELQTAGSRDTAKRGSRPIHPTLARKRATWAERSWQS